MSPYGYDYSLAPRASTGLRSRLTTVLTVTAIVAISAVSGAAVTLNLLGSPSAPAERPAIFAMHAPAASPPVVAQTARPAPPQPANATVAVAPRSQAPAPAVQPASPPVAAPAPQPKPVVAAVEAPPTAHVPDSELTFSRGYARRHAIQAAADAASAPKSEGAKTEGAKSEVARVETQGQHGRGARKTKAVAHTQDQRRLAGEGGPFSRFEQHERFDFGRHQALAFGDSRDPRPVRRPSPSGFFGGLF